MVIEVRPLHLLNASLPMLVTLLGMVVFLHPAISLLLPDSIRALQLSRESYTGFPLSTSIEDKAVQAENTKLPILVTLLGMDIVVRLVQ
jgi:hypothetical protein